MKNKSSFPVSDVLTRHIWTSSFINTLKQLSNFPAHPSAWCVIVVFFYSKCWLSCGNRHRTRNIIYTWHACHGSSNWKTTLVPHYSYMSCCACTFWNSSCIMLPPSVIRQIGDFSKGDSFYTSPRFVVVLTDWTARYSTTAGHCQLVRGNKVLSRLKSYFEFCSCLSPKLYDSTFCGSTQPFCRSQWPRSKASAAFRLLRLWVRIPPES